MIMTDILKSLLIYYYLFICKTRKNIISRQ